MSHKDSMKLSIVVPFWPIDEETDNILKECLNTIPFECEKIIVYNEGTGFAKNVNRGIKNSGGDYVAVVNSDTKITDGDIFDLCVPNTVCSPYILVGNEPPPRHPSGFNGCFWVAPKTVLREIGLMDERFEGMYWEDDDMLRRLEQANVPIKMVDSVIINHHQGFSMKKVPGFADHHGEENAARFREKWD